MTRSYFPVPLSLLLSLLLSVTVGLRAQEDGEKVARDRSLDKRRSLLNQQPTHEALFDSYFKMLVASNVVADETKALRDKLAKDKSDTAASIVLGRVLLRTGKDEEALETLDAIPNKTAEIQGVLGDIYLKLARFDLATRALDASMPAARTAEAKAGVLEKLGKAQLALKKKDAALATWRKIGELDGGKFFRRLRVAELLARAGLLEEAAAEYAPLLAETESDPGQHCRVLRATGQLHETRGDLPAAMSAYQRVLDLTDRGNWLRKEVEGRLVHIYRRTGRLAELAQRLESQLVDSPDDLADIEMLATVLTEMRELDKATAVLATAGPRFPKDVRLARRLAELYIEQNKIDLAIAEYQRVLSVKPDEMELYLELGQLFAKGERFAEAKNQWEKALARNLTDASLCTRIAAMYAMWNRREDAVRMYERAIELEPEAMVRYTDLADYHFAQSQKDDGAAVLDRALGKAKGNPRRLEALVGALREHGLADRARNCLTEWLTAEPENAEARFGLADLLLAEGTIDQARDLLWKVVEQDDRGSGHRTMAANTLVDLAARTKSMESLIEEASKRGSAGAYFLLGRAHTRQRDFERAIAAFRGALDRQPEDAQARVMLARLLAEDGAFQPALDEYQKLAMLSASARRQHFREIARLHLDLFDLDAAIDVWRTAMRDNPDNPAVFLEVGKEFMEIQRVQEALDAFQQAVRLRANDPDIQFRLAEALRQAGKVEDAEALLTSVAKSALDGRDREQARSRLFDMYGEQGLIEKRIDDLRARVEENPYDVDSPQLLGDIFMRTGDYVLGLEMVDKTVAFQPRNRELLTRRAELLEALEEWEKVLDVHRELIKFPDADRDTHLAGIGQAQYELGRAQDAKETFKQIRDRGKVSKLYQKYELHDEAIEYYQRAIARNPSDLRSYVSLAQDLVKRNRRTEAITALEKALTVKPFHREALQEIGKLYVQENRREEAMRAGLRLFGLRGEQTEKDRRQEYEEEQEQKRNRWWYGDYQSTFSQQRLQSAQGYFEERGLGQEWGSILVAEAKRRPADETLLENVKGHFGWRDKSAVKLAAFLRDILAVDEASLRVPPGYTKRSYHQMVEDSLVEVWQQDAAVAEARLAELATAEASPSELRERAVLQRSIGKLDDMEATLRASLARQPVDGIALALLVERLLEAKRYDDCVEPLHALLQFWDSDAGKAALAELALREVASFKRQRKELLDSLPRKIRRRLGDDDLLRVVQQTKDSDEWKKVGSFSFPEATPGQLAVVCKLVRVQKARNDAQGLAAAVEIARGLPHTIGERAHVGRVLFEEGQDAMARPLLDSVMAEGRAAQKDATLVYFWSRYQGFVSAAADSLGQLLAREGKVLDAYQVLREHGHGEKAELLVREHNALADVRKALETGVAGGAEALRGARGATDADTRSAELDYRDAVIKLADFHMGEKDLKAAEDIYRVALELLPEDLDVRKVVAALRLRSGDAEGAIKAQQEIIDVKRQRRRANAGDTAIPPTRLVPTVPGESSESQITYTGHYWYGQSGTAAQQQFSVAENYLAILNIYRDRNDHEGVLELLKRMTRDDPTTFKNMAWEVLDIVRNQDLGKRKLSVLRILKSAVSSDEWLQLEYAKACSEEGELKEAKRTLEKLITGSSAANNWYVEEANQEMTKVEQKLGEHKLTLQDLSAQVDKDPDNVRQRLKFAERLRKDNLYADCLAQAEAIVTRAPYMARAKELVVEAAAASGKDDVALAMMRRLFDETTESWKKLDRGVSLANWLYAEGKRDAAFTIIRGLESASGGSYNFSPGNWFLDRHMQDTALPLLEEELEKQRGNPWYRNQIRPRVIRVEMSTGKTANAIRRLLEDIDKAGSLADREQRWKDLLRAIKGAPDAAKLKATLEKDFGARQTATDCLVMAAAEFACGFPDKGEAELQNALRLSNKEVHLFPLILGLRRMHADYQGALDVLDQMSKVYGGSDAQQWYYGALNERDRLKVERATILWDMGKGDVAQQLVESLADETKPETMQSVAQIYSTRKMWDKALEWRRRYFAKKGTRDKGDYLAEATILIELKRLPEALELAKQAHLMSRGDDSARNTVTRIHRESKTLEPWIKELEAEYAKDIRDAGLRSSLLSLYGELDRDDDRRRVLEALLPHADLRDEALGGLMSLCNETDDWPNKLGYLQQKVELKGGEEKKQIYREIAEVLWKLERHDEARAAMEKALDLETADGWMEMANWFEQNKRDDDALVAYRKAFELDPKKHEVLAKEAAAAHKAKDWRAALEKAVAYLREMRGKAIAPSYQALFLNVLAAVPAAEQQVLLRGNEDDAATLEVAALLHVARLDWPSAERTARRGLTLAPDSFLALEAMRSALRWQERWKDLIDADEALRLRLEREYMITGDWDYDGKAQAMQDEIGRTWHLLGDDDAADRAWREQALRRTPYNNNTSSYRSDWSVRYTAEKWMSVLRPERALLALESEFLLRENPPWSIYLDALVQIGRGSEAEAIAWKGALDPLDLYGVSARVGGSDYNGGRDMAGADGMMRFLIDQHRKRGELQVLRAKSIELQANPATKIQGEKLEALVAERARDYRFLAETAEKKIAERATNNERPQANLHVDAAQRWLRSGEVDKALGHMQIVLDFDSAGLRDPKLQISQSEYEYERVYYGAAPPTQGGTTNPFAFTFGGNSGRSGYSYSSWRRSGGSTGYRSLAAALLRRSADDKKAQEVEDALLQEARPSQRRDVAGKIAQAYFDAQVWPHAVRLWRWCLEREAEFKLEAKDKAFYYGQIWAALRRAGEPGAEGEAVLTEWRQMLEAAVAEAPGPHAFAEKAALVRFHLETRDDPAPAIADLEWLLRFEPENNGYLALQARAERLRGEPGKAVAIFEAMAERRRRAGAGKLNAANERIEYGLSLLAIGRRDDAALELTEGLADAPEASKMELEAKAGLEKLATMPR